MRRLRRTRCAPALPMDIEGAEMVPASQWPENAFTDQIPRPQVGTVDYILDAFEDGRYVVSLTDISWEVAHDYLEDLQAAGYVLLESAENDVSGGSLLQRENVLLNVSYSHMGLGILITILDK